jgi:diaminopimelate epimerase
MGNPHAVVWVDDIYVCQMETLGPEMEAHPMFPNRTNVEFVQIVDEDHMRMRVWERGSGETFACGTGACAAVAAGSHCLEELWILITTGRMKLCT